MNSQSAGQQSKPAHHLHKKIKLPVFDQFDFYHRVPNEINFADVIAFYSKSVFGFSIIGCIAI